MSSVLKSQSQLTQNVSGLEVPNSVYGQVIDLAYGRCRMAHKLIWWNNFQSQQQGGKKGGKAGGSNTTYTVNADMILGYGPFEGLACVWQNQTWFYVNYSSQTFTGSGTSTSFTFTVSNNASTFIMVMGVAYQHSFSQAYTDYAGFNISRGFTVAGTEFVPLYNNNFTAPNNGFWNQAGIPYAEYNSSYGDDTVTVVFPSAVTNPVAIVYYCEVGGSDQPPTAGTSKKGGGGIPIQRPGLVFERELGSGPSTMPLSYPEFSGVSGADIPLGSSPVIPFFNYEVKALFGMGNAAPVASFNSSTAGYSPSTTSGDCNLADVVLDIITSGNLYSLGHSGVTIWNHGLGFTNFTAPDPTPSAFASQYFYSRYGGILKDESNLWGSGFAGNGSNIGLNLLRNYCLAYGIFISGAIDSQQPASQTLEELCEIANCAAVYDGGALDFIPYCEISNFANGASYVAPTAAGPIFNFTSDQFLPVIGKSPLEITFDRAAQNYNSLQIGYKDATQQYNDNFIIISDSMDITRQGSMTGPQKSYDFITSVSVAQAAGWPQLRRNLIISGAEVKFSLPASYECLLTQMDLVTVFDPTLLENPMPVRLKTIEISLSKDGKRKMDVTAEPFYYGASSPTPPTANGSAVSNSSTTNGSGVPGSVNTPIFIETVPALTPSGPQLWICVSGSDPGYGGCSIWMSTDGGSTYGSSPIGIITGRQTMGAVYSSNYPSHTDPDNSNTLNVDLTESLGALTSVSAAVQNAFGSLWYLAGGGTVTVNGVSLTIPYELGSFQTATLAATNKYSLVQPNHRGVYGTPIVAHNIGSAFSYLNDGLVFKMPLNSALIGVTLNFKFLAFNSTGGESQALSDVSPFTFTPSGLVGWSTSAGGGSGTGGNPTGNQPFPTTGNNPNVPAANDLYCPVIFGTYIASQELMRTYPTRNVTIAAGMTGSLFGCEIAPASNCAVTITKNGTSVGTINFTSGSTTATVTFTAAVTFNGTGDYISWIAPATPDPTFAGFFNTIQASRSN